MLEVVIDRVGTITPPTTEEKLGAQNVARHPDGSVWLNTTTTEPGLFKSSDGGQSWTSAPIDLAEVASEQWIAGFTITRDGRMCLVHPTAPEEGGRLYDPLAFVSVSTDEGRTWETTPIDYAGFAPGGPQDPYTGIQIAWCHPNFIDGAATPIFNRAQMFNVVPAHPPEHLYEVSTTPTVELSPNHFLTVYMYKGERSLKALSWHLEHLTGLHRNGDRYRQIMADVEAFRSGFITPFKCKYP